MYEFFSKSSFRAFCTLIFFVTYVCLNAQVNRGEEDSLKLVIAGTEGAQKFDSQYELIRYYFVKGEFSKALTVAYDANKTALVLSDSFRIVKSGRAIAYVEMNMDDLDAAIRDYTFYLGIAERNNFRDEVKYLLNNLAIAYGYYANYDKALEYHFQNLQIKEEDGDIEEISVTYNNIGFIYFKLMDWERALHYFEESERLKRESNSVYDLERCLSNIGFCYNKLSNFSKAIKYFNEALSFCENDCDDEVITESHFGLGVAYFETNQLQEAKEQFKISYATAIRGNNSVFRGESLLFLYKVYAYEQNYDTAFYYLSLAENLLQNTKYNELKISLFDHFAEYYNLLKNYEKAALYQSKYIQLKDSIYSDELIRNLAKVQTNYEERENLATIALKDEALLRQKRFNIAIITIAILAATLVFVLYRSNQVKQRVNKALSNAKATIEDQNKQLTTLNRNLEKMVDARTMELQIVNESLKRVNDELDNFIYKTSHDIRGPLASLKGICNVAMMDVSDPLALDYFMKLDATAEKLNTILTRLLIINQINNSAAGNEMIDFSEIVEDVIMLERKRGLPPNLNITKDIQDGIIFYSDKELVRIILENLIDNAIKFYNDSDRISPFVHIKVVNDDDFLTISVIDNGIGISQVNPDKIFQMFSRASERSGTGGIGLYLTKTATEKIGGQIDLKTTPEGYTEFFVRFSLNATNKIRAKVTV